MLAVLEGLELKDGLDAWAFEAWAKANTLAPADGDKVRLAFRARLGRLQTVPDENLSPAELDPPTANDESRSSIDKNVLALPEAKRLRDKQHLRFVAKQPCLVCGREPSDPHHIRFAQPRGLGTKGQRRVHRAPLSRASSRAAPRGKGKRLVVEQRPLNRWNPRAACGASRIRLVEVFLNHPSKL
jgi:hypothetical protein